MEFRQLMDHYYSFSFAYGSMSIDVLGLMEKERGLFVDAGYLPQGQMLKTWAEERGITEFEILLSHLHKDHYQGALGIMPKVIMGPSVKGHQMPEELQPLLSVYRNWNEEDYMFSGHRVTHVQVGGHSGCSQLIQLEKQLLHVGDLIIMDAAGKFSLPLVMGRVEDYTRGLQMIVDMHMDGFLGHGGYVPYKKLVYGAELTMDYLRELMLPSCSTEAEELKVMTHYAYGNKKYHAFNWRYHRGKTHV